MKQHDYECGTFDHISRRSLLKAAGLSGLAWLTPVARLLADEPNLRKGRPAQSVILLWLSGGPSQLETFDPHPTADIAGGTKAIETSAKGVQIAEGLPMLAEHMHDISVIRNVVSKEGDHERAAYNVKTGYRPDPTIRHPSLGAVVCHQLPEGKAEIPRHISIKPDLWFGRGGYLGQQYDAFRAYSVGTDLPDVKKRVSDERFAKRLSDLEVVERAFRANRPADLESNRTLHRTTIDRAVKMMSSDQLAAFKVDEESRSVLNDFGDSEFGKGCLAAMRLTDVGVRCVEVTLSGWDSHVTNHDIHKRLNKQLDPAFAALIKHLKDRDRFDDTIVICAGEFGRTPGINPGGGRDHWPHGFSVAIAGGGLRGGQIIGETDPEGSRLSLEQGTAIADVHTTILKGLGISPDRELDSSVGRPMKLSEGNPIPQLLG